MTVFLDASVIVAQILLEEDAERLTEKTIAAINPVTSAIALYESAAAIARAHEKDIESATAVVTTFLGSVSCSFVVIDEAVGREALTAFTRFGKGRHRADLNMGDCFAYACAKTHNLPLLCKGDDFIHTDIAIA